MKKILKFAANDKVQLLEKTMEYFTLFGFKSLALDNGTLKFTHPSSLLEAWKQNPLTWGSEIIITINENEVYAHFFVNTVAQINSIEEQNVWVSFIQDFKTFLLDNVHPGKVKTNLMLQVKRSKLLYICWTILGGLAGGCLGILLLNFTENKMVAYLAIPLFANIFLKGMLAYKKRKTVIPSGIL